MTSQDNELRKDDVLDDYVRRITEAVNYKGTSDCEDVISILKDLIHSRERAARQQMVDYYAKEFRKGYKGILPESVTEKSIAWIQAEADRLAELQGGSDE